MAIVVLIIFLIASYLNLNLIKLKNSDWILGYFLILSALIVVSGNLISALNQLDNLLIWFVFGLIWFFIFLIIHLITKSKIPILYFSLRENTQNFVSCVKDRYCQESNRFTKRLIFPMIITIIIVGGISLAVVLFSAPHSLDSMGYHLTRMAFYLQNGNLNNFGADYWAQEVHPKNATLLLIFTFLTSGKNENLTQVVQWVAYWISMLSVYGISRKMGQDRSASFVAGLGSGLVTIWVLEATTTQNDLFLTAFIGISTYFILSFREKNEWRYLMLSATGLGLAIGTKACALLAIFPIGLIGMFVFFVNKQLWSQKIQKLVIFGCFSLLAMTLFALPSGYFQNYQIFGHPIGPEQVRRIHSFEGQTLQDILQQGSLNLFRYGMDFISLDGLQGDLVNKIQSIFRVVPGEILRSLGIDLEVNDNVRGNFYINRTPRAHEDLSYWGVIGFGLVWILVWVHAFRKNSPSTHRIFAWSFLLFFIVQAFAGPYDPWRGRYFSTGVIFAMPLLGSVVRIKNRWAKAYIHIIILIACVSSISAIVFRNKAEIIINPHSINIVSLFSMDRMQQLTRNDVTYFEPFTAFEEIVPKEANVATMLIEGTLEYPLFGKKLTRKILPINSFNLEIKPIPTEADFLLYSESLYPCPEPDDVYLGRDLFLRELTETNRYCESLMH